MLLLLMCLLLLLLFLLLLVLLLPLLLPLLLLLLLLHARSRAHTHWRNSARQGAARSAAPRIKGSRAGAKDWREGPRCVSRLCQQDVATVLLARARASFCAGGCPCISGPEPGLLGERAVGAVGERRGQRRTRKGPPVFLASEKASLPRPGWLQEEVGGALSTCEVWPLRCLC